MAKKVIRKTSTARSKSSSEHKAMPEAPLADVRSAGMSSPRRARAQFRQSSLLLLAAILLIAGLIYIFKGIFVIAMVNGQPITRAEYNTELERQSGKQVLNTIVTKKLITQEAGKKNVTVSDTEINNEIKNIENNLSKQGRKLDDALTAQGLTREQLREQIKYQKLIQKMIGNKVKVTDKEVNDYIAKNSASLPQGQNPDQLKKSISNQLMQQKLNDATQTWIDNLQKNAKVNYFIPQ